MIPQTIRIPVATGLDEGVDSRLTAKLLRAKNVVQRKRGTLETRYGGERVVDSALPIYQGGSETAAGKIKKLLRHNKELVGIGDGNLYGVSSTALDKKGMYSRCNVEVDDLLDTPYSVLFVDAASISIYDAFAYTTPTGTTIDAGKIFARVVDNQNGTTLVADKELASFSSGLLFSQIRVVTTDSNNFHFFYMSGVNIKHWKYSINTQAWSGPNDVVTDADATLLANFFGACSTADGTSFYLFYRTTGANPFKVVRFNSSLTILATYNVVYTPPATINSSYCDVAHSFNGAAGKVWLAWGESESGGNERLSYAVQVGDLSSLVLGATLIEGPSVVQNGGYVSISPNGTADTVAIVWYAENCGTFAALPGESNAGKMGIGTKWIFANSTGTTWRSNPVTNQTDFRYCRYVIQACSPFWVSGRCYCIVRYAQYDNSGENPGSMYLIDLDYSNNAPTAKQSAIGICVAKFKDRIIDGVSFVTASKPIVSASEVRAYALTGSGIDRYAHGYVSQVLSRLTFTFGDKQDSDNLRELYVSGGCLTAYDGQLPAENNFNWYPDEKRINVTSHASIIGTLLATSIVYYVVQYEAQNAYGRVDRSVWTTPVPHTIDGGQHAPVVSVQTIGLTERENTDAPGIRIAIWRTRVGVGSGGPFFRVATLINDPTTSYVQFVDVVSDDSLDNHESLNLDLLDAVSPPSCSCVAVHNGRLFIGGTDDDHIWYSKTNVVDETPAFNEGLRIAPFEGGRVVALASYKLALFVLKRNAVYIIQGDGANDRGDPGSDTFTSAQLLVPGIGCISAESVEVTPLGVTFESDTGIVVVGLDGQVKNLGDAVVDKTTAAKVRSIVTNGKDNEIRFILSPDTPGADSCMVVYDYKNDCWYHWEHKNNANAQAYPGSAVIVNDVFYWLDLTDGDIYKERRDLFTDDERFVACDVEFGWVDLTGNIQDYKKLRRVSILGKKYTNHGLQFYLYRDFSETATNSPEFLETDVNAMSLEQMHIHAKHQRCQAFKLRVQSTTPPSLATGSGKISGTGKGFSLTGLEIEFVTYGKLYRNQPAARKK